MKKEVYTVAIMSFTGRPMRTFSISLISLILISVSVVLAVISGIAFTSVKVWKAYNNQVQANSVVIDKYVSLQKDFQKLQKELTQIKETCQGFKSILGVEVLNSGGATFGMRPGISEQWGTGGSETPVLEDFDISATEEIADGLETDMWIAMRDAVSLKSDLENLIENASSKMARLTRIPSICPIYVDAGSGYRVSSWFGPRISPFTGLLEFHQGLDIPAPIGTPIWATADGIVASVGADSSIGNYVLVKHDERFSTIYGHMSYSAYGMERGTKIKRYDILGYVGSTGRSTGPHVHYEVRDNGKRVNPIDYILN